VERDFNVGQVVIRQTGIGQQSWYDLATGLVNPNDHQKIYQCNIIKTMSRSIKRRAPSTGRIFRFRLNDLG
jgi:hypothetical protein